MPVIGSTTTTNGSFRLGLAAVLLALSFIRTNATQAQLCALDVFVANDQSGSVSALENTQSRQFISALFMGMQPWGTGAGESRMAIADWDSPNVWQQFSFPSVGASYTTEMSDVLAYQNATRALLGGTDPVTALSRSFQQIGQAPIAGRTAKPIIVLMTDADCSQVPAGLTTLATQIKNAGVTIVVVAIEAASLCTSLMGAQVASPGAYFSAPTYAQLVQANVQLVQAMINAGCSVGVDPSYDLSIAFDSFTASGCITGIPAFQANYTVTNNAATDFNGPLMISFYSGDPAISTSAFLTTQNLGTVSLPAGASMSGSLSGGVLASTTALYAIVNFNGAIAGHAPPIGYLPPSETFVPDEWATFNNVSPRISRVNDPVTCPPQALLSTTVVNLGVGCDDLVPYEVSICNTGDAAAYIVPSLPIAVPGAVPVTNLNETGTYAADLDWATYYGGTLLDEGQAVATDASGNVYLAGLTRSTGSISTAGAHLVAAPGGRNAFLAKFNNAGVRQWATYYGGTGNDFGLSVATDAAGNVYLAGYTSSTTGISTAGSHQAALGGSDDAFLVKFNAAGVRQWGTYYGGTGADVGYSVTTDAAGNVYLAGTTESAGGIATAGAHQAANGGLGDNFLVKFNAAGVRQWGTYYGGSDTEDLANVACDPAGNVHLVGQTLSNTGIATVGAFQPNNNSDDVYLVRFNGAGVRQWATYFGGTGVETFPSVACDPLGNIFLSGTTNSTDVIDINAPYQPFSNGGDDGFLTKFDAAGSPAWSTYVSGEDDEVMNDVAVDAVGRVTVAGFTKSVSGISTSGSFKESIDGTNRDAFAMKFNNDGILLWGTYFGGEDDDENYAVAVDPAGDVYVVGLTASLVDLATTGAHQTVNNDNDDAYLAKFGEHELPRILYPGDCFVRQYIYDYSALGAGTYNLSLGLTASVFDPGDPLPLIMPDQHFNAGTFTDISGFNGAAHTSDNAVIPAAGSPCATGDRISVSVNIPTVSSCGNGNYAQATITITNLSGITVTGADLDMDLTGLGATYVGEPYNVSAGLDLAAPNLLDPAYPFILHAINGHSGAVQLPILSLPPGVSTFQVDINIGSTLTNLLVQVINIHTAINSSGLSNTGSDASGVSALTVPVIANFTCPGAINAGGNISLGGISVTGASSVQWASTTVASLAGGGTLASPTITYVPTPLDIANGFVAISLTALSASGCDATVSCQIDIANVQYDYGDAPVVYDMNINYQPPAAASTLLSGLVLGISGPTTETIAHNSVMADGDGNEEDALVTNPYTAPWPGVGGVFDLQIRATNNTATESFVHAFVDWNADGDFLDSLESSSNTVVKMPFSGLGSHLMHFVVPPFANPFGLFYIRLRLSADSMAVTFPYMAAPLGETEDYVWESVGILPVELLSFTGTDEGPSVRLEWTTATEHNTSHFELERGRDGVNYTSIGTLAAAGFSAAVLDYSFTDPSPLDGLSFYRLVQVDLDGSVAYHGPVAIEHRASAQVWAQPLPGDGVLLHGVGWEEVHVHDHNGRLVASGPLTDGQWHFSGGVSGVYVAILRHESRSETLRFVIP
ncbi:MAG: SBBP repeat-containing protein [Flavobacteriales bacterium]|nr:SBBP repeat-containing protein [Flavobacteriales bacterium]